MISLKGIDFKKLLFYLIITFIIGSSPSIFVSTDAVDTLVKPALYPPNILFPIAWSILFILMGTSAYLSSNDEEARKAYFTQLIVNALWTPLFFGLNLYLLSFLWIILLIILVIKMMITFSKENKLSAYLNIPYLLWLLFAAYLNLGIVILN